MECSFCISLARDSKEWTPTVKLEVKDSLKETWDSPTPRPYLKQNIKPVSKTNYICLFVFINKGLTGLNCALCLCSKPESLQNATTCLPCYGPLISTWLFKRISPNLLICQTFMGLKTQFVKLKSSTFWL